MSNLLAKLELVKRPDLGSDVDLLSLLPWVTIPDGWQQAPSDGEANVDEVMTLNIEETSHNNLADVMQDLDTLIKEIGWAQHPLEPNGVWLRAQLYGETNARLAFLTKGKRGPARVTSPAIWSSTLYQYPLGLTRRPLWEATAATPIPASPGAITIHGGTIACTIGGDADARVALLSASAAGSLNEVWFGVKSTQYGVTPANFVPVWHCHSGGAGFSDVTQVSDATALDGTKLTCTFATVPTMDYRSVVTASQAAPLHPADQRGTYLLLLRAKTTDASLTVDLRIGHGYRLSSFNYSFTFQPLLRISNAAAGWKYYSLGYVQIPPVAGFTTLSIAKSAIGLKAEKISGSGSLDLDSYILIPAEHYIHAAFTNIFTTQRTCYLSTLPSGRQAAAIYAESPDSALIESTSPDAIDWSIPAGNSVIVVCADDITENLAADTITPALQVVPCYTTLRGAA